MGNHELDPWVESGEGRVVPGAFCWGAHGGGRAYPGPGCFLLCLQSSGNVWVTHEEMETLATSTKTVSLPLGPGTSDSPEDEVRNVGSQRGWQRPSVPDCGRLCARGHKTLTSLGYRGRYPVMGLSHKLPVLGSVLGGEGGKNGSLWHRANPQSSLGTVDAWFRRTNLLPPPQACMYVPAFSTAPASLPWSPMSYRGGFPLFWGSLGGGSGFLDFPVSPTCGTGSC